jgi:CO/xanthine dehydrogenase Mo-binding subunit
MTMRATVTDGLGPVLRLERDLVRGRGHFVVAATRKQVAAAARCIDVDYEVLPHRGDVTAASGVPVWDDVRSRSTG